jgi:two-component system phosphate regulon sensor histidine kinase PhoR
MTTQDLKKLAAHIRTERDRLLASWRALVRQLPNGKHLDTPTLNDHIPAFLEDLAKAFEVDGDASIADAVAEKRPTNHGMQRQENGYDIVELVAEYNMLRGCLHDFAEGHGVQLRGRALHILNRVLDQAISSAVQAFAMQAALEVQKRREEYLAFVAHDLRTPLNAISLATTALELGQEGAVTATGDMSQMLRTLHRNVRQLSALIDAVLKESAHVRTETGVKLERRRFELWPLVESLIYDLRPIATTAGTKLVNTIGEHVIAHADASLVRRVFQNLVTNAIRSASCSEVVIGARESAQDGSLECWVKDDGHGIPAERIETIFDKLESDPEREDGNGLGLAIVKAFVEAHGGSVTVESQAGLGSTFTFTLPERA